jgi:hypothetical protein
VADPGPMDAVLAELKRRYPVQDVRRDDDIVLRAEGVDEEFVVAEDGDGWALFGDTWHEHFESAEELGGFLVALFRGQARIVAKFRGRTAVGHRVEVIQDGRGRTVSRTGLLLPLFWRRKSYRTMDYTVAARGSPAATDGGSGT